MSGNLSYSGFARSTYDQLMINNGSVGVMLCDQQVITSCAGLERSMCDLGGDQDGLLPIGAFFPHNARKLQNSANYDKEGKEDEVETKA